MEDIDLFTNESIKQNIVNFTSNIYAKCDTKSAELRKKGNELFAKKLFEDALDKYCEAIVYATNTGPELCCAFANRSAALFHLKEYELCLKDIEHAIQFGYPTENREKLNNRLKLCEQQLSKNSRTENSVNKDETMNDCLHSNVVTFTTQNGEKGLKAKCKILKGETILVEKAYVSCLLQSNNECAKLSWNECHSIECQFLDMFHISDHFQFSPKLLLKILIKNGLEACLHSSDNESNLNQYSQLNDFIEHKDCNDYFSTAKLLLQFLLFKTGNKTFSNEDKTKLLNIIEKHIRQIQVNAITVFTRETYESLEDKVLQLKEFDIGCGVYLKSRLLNHSCKPNCEIAYFDGNVIKIKSCEEIDEGAELLISYGAHYKFQTFTRRQTMLKESYFFDCKCIACTQLLQPVNRAFRCPACDGPVVSDAQLKCLKCGQTDHLDVKSIFNTVKNCFRKIDVCYKLTETENYDLKAALREIMKSYDTLSTLRDLKKECEYSEKYFKIASSSPDPVFVFNALLKKYCISLIDENEKQNKTEKCSNNETKALKQINELLPEKMQSVTKPLSSACCFDNVRGWNFRCYIEAALKLNDNSYYFFNEQHYWIVDEIRNKYPVLRDFVYNDLTKLSLNKDSVILAAFEWKQSIILITKIDGKVYFNIYKQSKNGIQFASECKSDCRKEIGPIYDLTEITENTYYDVLVQTPKNTLTLRYYNVVIKSEYDMKVDDVTIYTINNSTQSVDGIKLEENRISATLLLDKTAYEALYWIFYHNSFATHYTCINKDNLEKISAQDFIKQATFRGINGSCINTQIFIGCPQNFCATNDVDDFALATVDGEEKVLVFRGPYFWLLDKPEKTPLALPLTMNAKVIEEDKSAFDIDFGYIDAAESFTINNRSHTFQAYSLTVYIENIIRFVINGSTVRNIETEMPGIPANIDAVLSQVNDLESIFLKDSWMYKVPDHKWLSVDYFKGQLAMDVQNEVLFRISEHPCSASFAQLPIFKKYLREPEPASTSFTFQPGTRFPISLTTNAEDEKLHTDKQILMV
ncbi:SET and MYND domain-containing protein (SMYD)-like protein [Leptotrombidium deliense]|uniref:SET and MYND domain-containing protein (SMYD)-like protein n=1 Tax=Leptotrombidium deliense TaxID=299467 RepID=A0A443SMD8_9ACAR|nr:SET and MYND domain-containing protein (SMYD)-like protein [Leptotrombidium deliense]